MLNCLRDTECKYFLAFNSTSFYSLSIWVFGYIYIQTTFLVHFDLKMTLSERRNVVGFLKFFASFFKVFNRDGFNFCHIAMFYS